MGLGDKLKKLFSNSSVSSTKYNSIGNYNVPNSSYNASNDLAIAPKVQNTVQDSGPSSRGGQDFSPVSDLGGSPTVHYTLDPEGVAAREFSLYMSNTAHQREVADLKAAGLNPVLSANGGANGYSAATGQNTDLAKAQLQNALIQTAMNNNSAERIANINAGTNYAIAQLNSNTALANTGSSNRTDILSALIYGAGRVGQAYLSSKHPVTAGIIESLPKYVKSNNGMSDSYVNKRLAEIMSKRS